jgi:Tfp pilus assembly protein PilO
MDNISNILLKNREQVVMGAVILLSVLVSKGIYGQQMNQYTKLKNQISEEQQKGAALERIVGLNERIKKLKVNGWDSADFNSIIDKIYNIALESKIKIRDITPQEKKDEKNYIIIPMIVNGEANYRDLYNFIKKLETYSMLTHIQGLAVDPMSKQEPGATTLLLKISLNVETIYFK